MSEFLSEMVAASAVRARETRSRAVSSGLMSRVTSAPPPVAIQLGVGFDVIAEAKLASPSDGRLTTGDGEKVVALARDYTAGGAAAVSVLTEETRFGGALGHLEAAAAAVEAPVMRKDFLVDPIQVSEARAAGASGILLIARILTGDLLVEMTDLAISLGMFVLLEVFDLTDIDLASTVFDRDILVGVNCRDLTSLQVDPTRFDTLAPHLPARHSVAESGIEMPADVARVVGLGYRLALIGSSLVGHDAPGRRLAELIDAGREALAGAGA